MNNLAEEIKNARKNLGMSQKTLASLLGVQTQTVWRWEKGEREPNWDIIQTIASLLKAPQLTENINELEQNNTSKSSLGLGYWGSVVDNAKKIVEYANLNEISLIETLLKSACEILNFKKQEIIKNSNTTLDTENKLNATSSANVDIHHNDIDIKGTNFNFANTTVQ